MGYTVRNRLKFGKIHCILDTPKFEFENVKKKDIENLIIVAL